MGRLVNVGDTVEVLNGRLAGTIGRLVKTNFRGPSEIVVLYPPVIVEKGDRIEIMPAQLRAVEIVREEKTKQKRKQ